MKNKYFLLVVITCVAALMLMKPAVAVSAPVAEKTGNKECCFSYKDTSPAILCEPTSVNFSVRNVRVFSGDHIKVSERILKNKFLAEKNFKIEISVANYIFFIESIACYHNNFTELRRLNI